MAKGILIDVGFTSEGLKDYINDIEREFKSVNWGEKIGLSDALDKQIGDVKDKIAELKKELEALGKGHGIDANFKTQFEEMNKSIKVLQQSMKVLMESAPKSKQAGLSNQLSQINQQIQNTAEVAKNTSQVLSHFTDAKIVNAQQLNELRALYNQLERARQAAENFDKTTKKVGNKPYLDTDEIITDIKAQYELYLDLDEKIASIQDKKKISPKDEKEIDVLNAKLTESVTRVNRLIVTLATMKESWGNLEIDKGINLNFVSEEMARTLDDLLKQIADKKARIQSEFTSLGGKGDLSSFFVKATSKAKEKGITIPVFVAPGAKEDLIEQCNVLISDINAKLTDTPIQVEVQLVTAYQSKRNTALIQSLQQQIVAMEENAKNAIANGASEVQASKWTELSKDMTTLLSRLNKQIDNAMIFTVEVNTSTAINTVNAFIEEVREKLPKIKPDMELSASAKRSFKAQVNSFIKNLNKEIVKLQIEKDKMNNDVFASYIQQLTNAVNLLKDFSTTLNKGDFINIEEKIQQLRSFKETFDRNIAGIQLELINAFDPEKNNLGLWSSTLLSTLQTALIQIQKISEYKLFQIDNSQTQQATTEMVKTAEESTADEQQSNSPSKVAEKLGEYWGEGYAKGILNTQTKVKNAIRALVDTGKITMLELAKDRMVESDMVNNDIANGKKNTAKKYTKAIQSLDDYKAMIASMGIKTPTDSKLKQSVLETQKKNLEDIRAGAIDAQKAIDNLLKAFGGKFTNGDIKSQYRRYWSEEFTTPAGIPAARADNIDESSSNPMLGIKRIDPNVIQNVIRMRKEVDELLNQLQNGKAIGEYTEDEIIEIDDKFTRLTQKLNTFKANGLFADNTLEEQPFREINKWLDSWAKLSIEKEQATKNEQNEVQAKQEVVKATEQQIEKEKEFAQTKAQIEVLNNGDERIVSDIGLTYEQLIQKLRQENDEIEKGNKLFQERVVYLKNGVVVDSFQGNDKEVAKAITDKQYDKIVHTHPVNRRGSGAFSYSDIRRFYENKMEMPSFSEAELFSGGNSKVILQFSELTQSFFKKYSQFYQSLQEAVSVAFGKETDYGKFIPDETITNEVASAYLNALAKSMINSLGGDLKFNIQDITLDDTLTKQIHKTTQDFQHIIEDYLNKLMAQGISEEAWEGVVKGIYHDKLQEYRDFYNKNKLNITSVNDVTTIEQANKQIAKSEEKPITKTQQLIEQFETLHQLMQDAFGNKDLSLMQKYFTDMQNVNAQMGKSHIKGAKDRGSLIQGYQDAISNIENEKKQTEAIKQKTEAIKISKKEQEALTQAEHEFIDSISSAENNVLGTNIQTLQQKAEVIKVSKEEQEAYTAAEHEFIDSIAKSENNVLHTNAQEIEQKTKQIRISKQQQEELTKGEHELVDSLREEQNAILGINQQTEQEIKVQEQLKNTKSKQKSTSDVKQTDVTKALNKEVQTVVPGLKEETAELNKLKNVLKDIPQLINDKTNAFVDEKKAVKNAVTSEISDLGKLSKAQAEEKKKKEQEANLNKAQKNLNKNYEQIQNRFTSMLQQDNRTLIESSFEPTKDGLIKIKALIKEADDSYKSFIYTTKTGKGKNPFTLVEAKEGFTIDKQAALYEKFKKAQEALNKEPQMIGNVRPNTEAWEQLLDLARNFGLEVQDIVKIIRNVDHGVESFQFFDRAGNRTTLGINSDYKLYERNPIFKMSEDVDVFKKKIADLPKIIRNGIVNYDANASSKYIDNLKQIAELWQRITEYRQLGNLPKEDFDSLKGLFGGSSETILDTISARLPLEKKTPEMVQNIETLRTEFNQLFNDISQGGYSIDDISNRLTILLSDAKTLYQNINADSNKLANSTAITKLLANIGDELSRNTKMSSVFREQLQALVKEIQGMGQSIPNDKFKDFATRFQNIRSQIHLAGQTGKGFFDQMGTSLGRSVIQFANMYLSLYRIVSYIRQGVSEVTKLDKALTTMSYTMNITNSQLKEMGNNIVDMAKDLKVSVDNVSQIYQIYANMQTTTEEMMKTARPTAILTNLSGVDASTAADQIQGVLNQFNMLADESMHIVDVYDYISANIPVDYSKGIAGMSDAVKNVGNVAAEAGLSFEQLSAIIGKVMAKTRQDGASIGNALRTILVRVSKANKLAGDEVDNATVGNAAKALHKIGVEVYTTSGEFREFDTIMTELAAKWDDLSDAEQANISFQIAATRQTATLKAVLDQWVASMKLATEATEANGNALANQEKYEASIAGRTQALRNEMTEFWINTLNSDVIKDITSELTKFVGELNKANSSAGALVTTVGNLVNGLLKLANSMPSGSALGLLLGLTKGRNWFTSINSDMGGVNLTLGHIAKTFGANKLVTANDVKLFRDYTNLLKNETIPVSQAWNDTMANASIQAQQMATNAAVSGKSVNATMAAMRVQVMATRAAAVALNVALSIGLTVAITGVISLISQWVHAEENNRKKIRESINTLKERNETLKKQQKTIDDTIEKYKEYSKQLSDISTTEEERYEIRKDLYELQEDIIDQFGKTAEGLDLVNGKYDEQLKYLQNITEEQRKSYVVNSAGNYLSNKKAIESFYPVQVSKMFMDELGTNAYVQFQNSLPNMSNYSTLSASETKKFWEDLIYKETIGETNYFSKELQDSVVTAWQNFIDDESNLLSNAIDAERENAIYEQFVAEGSIYAEDYKAITSLIQELRGYITNNEFEKYDQRINDLLAYDLNNYKDAGEIVYSAFESLFKQFTIPTNLKNYQPNANNLLQDYYATQKNKYQNNITTLDNLIGKSFPNYYQGSEYYTQYGEELKTTVQNIMDKQGMTFEEVEKEIHFLGDSVIDFIKKYTPEELPKELSTFDKWLEESSSIYSDDKKQEKYTNNALIDAYKSSISGFKDFITNDEQGKIQINFGEIAKFIGSTDFFKQIGMESFENYVYGFGEDAKILEGLGEEEAKLYARGFGENADALGAYIHDALGKVLHNIDSTQLTEAGMSLLTDMFHNINADIFGVSESTAKIEQSYWELRDIQKRVQEGEEFSKDEATYLMQKYDSLYGALEERIKGIDETTGELITTYKIEESAIDSLVNEYGTMSNEAITSMKNQSIYAKDTIEWLRKMEYEILQAQIDLVNFNTASKITAQGLMDAYNTRDARSIAEALKGVTNPEDRAKLQELTSQIGRRLNELVQGYSYDLKIQDDDGTGKGKGSGDKDNKAQYDWLDSYLDKRNRALQKEETAYDRLTNKVIKKGDIETKYTQLQNQSLEEQNKLLDDQIAAYDEAEKEYGRRMKKGLLYNELVEAFDGSKNKADEIVQKIINREDINLLEYTSEQSSAISAMADNYNKQLDAADKKLEAQNTKRENALKMFTNNIELITKKFDHVLNEFAQRQSQLEHYQSMRTNSGMMENQKLYLALLDNESRELEANIQKRNELTATLDAMKPKTEAEIEEWWNTKDAIDATTQAIWESEEAIVSYQKSMRQLSWDLNDKIRDITGNVRNETSFLIDTLGTFEKDMYSYERDFLGNDAEKTKIYNGQMSDQGLATLALRRVNAKAYREDIERINKEVADAQKEYLKNTADVDALDRLNNLISERNGLIQSYNDEREAILSLVKDGYDKQLQSLEAITSKYMEALNAERDLYQYQKNIAKQTKNIANIRKMMSAYAGDMSEEARAKMQTLTVQLEEAEEGLADTQYERQLSDQQRIFDHLYQSLEDYFNDKLENPEKVLKSTEQLVNDNMPRIKDTLNNTLSFYKTNISKSLDNILDENGINKIANNIAAVDGDIQGIKTSVNSTGEDLKRYLEDNNLKKQKEETIYDRIDKLYDEDNLFGKNFTLFNTKLDEINASIKGIDKQTETTTLTESQLFSRIRSEYGAMDAQMFLKLLRQGTFDEYMTKNKLKLVGHAAGVKRLTNDELAWTQENGLEAILRPTDNAILTPLKAGDSVLNAQATQTLWDFANNPLAFMKQNLGMTTVSKSAGVTFNNSMSPTIVVNGVSNANEFIRELQKNKQFESMIQDMTINQMNGGNPLAKMKYKF